MDSRPASKTMLEELRGAGQYSSQFLKLERTVRSVFQGSNTAVSYN